MSIFIRLIVSGVLVASGCLLPGMMGPSPEQVRAEMVARCDSPERTYEVGYNDGLQHKPMDTRWIDGYCHSAVHASVRDNYQNGFREGAANAPKVVQHNINGGGGYVGDEPCRFSNDCMDGQSCRTVHGGGERVCMGYGGRGAPCWFGSDCLSDRCRYLDGTKTCR